MTDKEYKDNNGNCCPKCGSKVIEGYTLEKTDETDAFIDKVCIACKAKWTEEWTIAGYEAEFK